MKIRISAIIGLLFGSLLLTGPWNAAARDASPPAVSLAPARASAPAPAGAPAAVQDFQDVPTGSTFYTYIHNLFLDGVVSGYACGGAGEPCVPPGNLPYFRPGNNVTRGQNAKLTDNGRRLLTGPHPGGAQDYGLFSAINTDESSSLNAALYGQGATAVFGESMSSGDSDGYGGYFHNSGGGTGPQWGIFADSAKGTGVEGVSAGSTAGQSSAGVVGKSVVNGGAGGVFTGSVGLVADGASVGVVGKSADNSGMGGDFTANNALGSVGLVAAGWTGAMLAGGGTTVFSSNDGLEVGGAGGSSYAINSIQPTGDTNFTLYGWAHIHGTNIASDDYENEVVYDGAAPLALGSVVALDPANIMGGPLGVLPAGIDNADAAIGVISYRLSTVQVNGADKTVIDAQARAVQPGDRAYITILGRVAMELPAGAKVGARLAVGSNGGAVVAETNGLSFGRVASRPDGAGRGYVLVNFK